MQSQAPRRRPPSSPQNFSMPTLGIYVGIAASMGSFPSPISQYVSGKEVASVFGDYYLFVPEILWNKY